MPARPLFRVIFDGKHSLPIGICGDRISAIRDSRKLKKNANVKKRTKNMHKPRKLEPLAGSFP
jgi:hypothetical protein